MSYFMNNMHMSLLGDYRAANLTKRFYEGLGITQAQ